MQLSWEAHRQTGHCSVHYGKLWAGMNPQPDGAVRVHPGRTKTPPIYYYSLITLGFCTICTLCWSLIFKHSITSVPRSLQACMLSVITPTTHRRTRTVVGKQIYWFISQNHVLPILMGIKIYGIYWGKGRKSKLVGFWVRKGLTRKLTDIKFHYSWGNIKMILWRWMRGCSCSWGSMTAKNQNTDIYYFIGNPWQIFSCLVLSIFKGRFPFILITRGYKYKGETIRKK